MRKGLVIGGMVLGLLMGCNNGLVEQLEKKSSFYESVIKIGHGFQEIFGIFGNTMGDAFGIVKSGDKRDKVGAHLKKIESGLTQTKDKLKELSDQISESKNADGSTIETVKNEIKGANDVFEQIISALTKLANVTNDSSLLGDTATTNAVGADKDSVNKIIAGIREIIKIANKFDVKIETRSDGGQVQSGANNSVAVLTRTGNDENTGAVNFASEIAKSDPWAMIDKIKSSKDATGGTGLTGTEDAGDLATKTHSSNAAAKSSADVAAAVVLKAMTKGGKFNSNGNAAIVKAAAASAVNKVLGVLDVIISRTVSKNLEKVREAVKKIQYSENTETEAKK